MMKQSQQSHRIVRFEWELSGFVIGTHHQSNWNGNSKETKAFSKHSLPFSDHQFRNIKSLPGFTFNQVKCFSSINRLDGKQSDKRRHQTLPQSKTSPHSLRQNEKSIQFKIWFGVNVFKETIFLLLLFHFVSVPFSLNQWALCTGATLAVFSCLSPAIRFLIKYRF